MYAERAIRAVVIVLRRCWCRVVCRGDVQNEFFKALRKLSFKGSLISYTQAHTNIYAQRDRHARTHPRTHTHARTHARTHTHKHKCASVLSRAHAHFSCWHLFFFFSNTCKTRAQLLGQQLLKYAQSQKDTFRPRAGNHVSLNLMEERSLTRFIFSDRAERVMWDTCTEKSGLETPPWLLDRTFSTCDWLTLASIYSTRLHLACPWQVQSPVSNP